MKVKTFQLKEILPNPFRRTEKYPLLESKIEALIESIETTEFWENVVVRINKDGEPELAYGHHRLGALRRIYPGTKEFDWIVRPLTDGVMIQMMARENGESYKTDPAVLRETITAAVQAHGKGLILPSEMRIESQARKTVIRSAPSFSICTSGPEVHPYTVEALAKFLGSAKPDGDPQHSFVAAFGALELINEGYLTEARIKGIGGEKLLAIVSSVRKQRDAAIEENKKRMEAAEAAKKEAERKAAELKKQQEEAEARRKAAVEAERLAAIKRAEEKAKRDAEEKIRAEAEAKRKKAEAEARAVAEAKRKEEEEKQRKIREAQRVEAEKQRVEAERVRQIALAKAKKEADERKAEQMRKDAEAAKVRAEAEAKRKEEAAKQAEVAAKKRAEDEKVRQAAAAKKRAEDEARQAEQRKTQEADRQRKEADRAEAARLKVIADKKAADEADRKKREEIAVAEAKQKAAAAKAAKDEADRKAQIKAAADKLADESKRLKEEEIRARGQRIAEETAAKSHNSAVRHAAAAGPSVDSDTLRKFMDAMNSANPARTVSQKEVPRSVVAVAKEMQKFAKKGLAQKYHPDAGGSNEQMQILNAAFQWVTLLIEQNEEK